MQTDKRMTDCTIMPLHVVRVFSKQIYAIIYIIVLSIGVRKSIHTRTYTHVYMQKTFR